MNWEYQDDRSILEGDLVDNTYSILFHKAFETKREALWDHLLREHTTISDMRAPSEDLVILGKRLVGTISFCSAAYKLGPRDQFVG
jgi:hypothetical protein